MELQTGIFGELLGEQRDRLLSERRSSLENPQTPLSYPAEWLLDIFNGGRTDSGIRVSELTAFQASTFLACVDLIGGSLASLPQHVYERTVVGNGRASHRIAYEHDQYDIIHLEPNEEMSHFVFLKAFMAHVLAWGNGYAELQRDAGNQVIGIWPRNPYKTRPHRLMGKVTLEPVPWRPFAVTLQAGELVYRTTDGIEDIDYSDHDASHGDARLIPAADMLHLPGLAFDGRIGQSVVWLARQTIGLALATEKFGAKYFANFAKPGGILELPSQKPEDREKTKQSWMEAQGGENAHRIAVVPPGTKWTPLSNRPDESQMTETETATCLKICSFFHVPAHMVGVGRTQSRSNTEQLGQEYISYTLMPWITGIKQEWKRKLFPSIGIGRTPRNRFYVDFDLTDLQRADAASRNAFYSGGRQWAYLNTNDIRAFEKLNPIDEPWAEDYWMPINMTLADTPLDPNTQDGDGDGEKKKQPATGDDASDERYSRLYSRLFRDAFGRVLARDRRDLRAITAIFQPILGTIRDGFSPMFTPGAESEKFIADYLGAMAGRAAAWTAADADRELRRAIPALRIAACREQATLEAKSLADAGGGEPDEESA